MKRYTLYCSLEQTKKALELGAPIERGHEGSKYFNIGVPTFYNENDEICRVKNSVVFVPTAEEMLGWLAEQGLAIDTEWSWNGQVTMWVWYNPEKELIYTSHANSLKEATLAAIDSALEYLKQQKNKL